MSSVLEKLKNNIIVSVQASEGEPLNTPSILCAMAEAALNGGAVALRMAQDYNIRYFKDRHPDTPVIGITKPKSIPSNAEEIVYITPTFEDVCSLASYCEIVALDATQRPRPHETLKQIVQNCRSQFSGLLLMADVSTFEEGLNAAQLGFDLISTTLSGYTTKSHAKKNNGPDFELLSALVKETQCSIVLEGRVWEPSEVQQAFSLGAHSVVIGSAITRPHDITRRFVQASHQTV